MKCDFFFGSEEVLWKPNLAVEQNFVSKCFKKYVWHFVDTLRLSRIIWMAPKLNFMRQTLNLQQIYSLLFRQRMRCEAKGIMRASKEVSLWHSVTSCISHMNLPLWINKLFLISSHFIYFVVILDVFKFTDLLRKVMHQPAPNAAFYKEKLCFSFSFLKQPKGHSNLILHFFYH